MLTQEAFVSINTTPDVVERWLTDPALLDQWRSALVVFQPLEGDLMTLGSIHKLRLKSLALSGAIYTVAERDSGHILLTIDGLWRGRELWRWFSDGGRTIVQNRVEYVVPDDTLRVFVVGIGNLLGELDMRLQLERLRQMIEGPVRPAHVNAPQRIPIEQP